MLMHCSKVLTSLEILKILTYLEHSFPIWHNQCTGLLESQLHCHRSVTVMLTVRQSDLVGRKPKVLGF